LFKGGVISLNSTFNDLVVGSLDGSISKVRKADMILQETCNVGQGPIVALTNSEEKIYALTQSGTLHSFGGNDRIAAQSQFMAAFSGKVSSIVFPRGFSKVFACMGSDEIRIFNVDDQKELLKIQIQDKLATSTANCNCLEFMSDGKSIVTGWTDGMLRAFTPQSGQLLYLIKDAHTSP
jgi:cilia- and flagella-associated protein 52